MSFLNMYYLHEYLQMNEIGVDLEMSCHPHDSALEKPLDSNRQLLLKGKLLMALPEKILLLWVIICLMSDHLSSTVHLLMIVVDAAVEEYHYLAIVFVHNQQRTLYRTMMNLKMIKF